LNIWAILVGSRSNIPSVGAGTYSLRNAAENDWWYARLGRAGVVEPGTTHGHGLRKARHTAGQRVFGETGSLRAVRNQLGLSTNASANATHAEGRKGKLDAIIDNVRRQIRPLDDDGDRGQNA